MAIVVFLLEVAEEFWRITLDFISGPLGPLSLDIWGQDFPKVMLGAKGKSVPTMGPVAIVILLLEATEEITLILFQGPWGPNYSKALQGPMGYKCTKFVPHGYCSFFARGGRRKHL